MNVFEQLPARDHESLPPSTRLYAVAASVLTIVAALVLVTGGLAAPLLLGAWVFLIGAATRFGKRGASRSAQAFAIFYPLVQVVALGVWFFTTPFEDFGGRPDGISTRDAVTLALGIGLPIVLAVGSLMSANHTGKDQSKSP